MEGVEENREERRKKALEEGHNYGAFTEEEEERFLSGLELFGRDWKMVSLSLFSHDWLKISWQNI